MPSAANITETTATHARDFLGAISDRTASTLRAAAPVVVPSAKNDCDAPSVLSPEDECDGSEVGGAGMGAVCSCAGDTGIVAVRKPSASVDTTPEPDRGGSVDSSAGCTFARICARRFSSDGPTSEVTNAPTSAALAS